MYCTGTDNQTNTKNKNHKKSLSYRKLNPTALKPGLGAFHSVRPAKESGYSTASARAEDAIETVKK